MKKKTEEEQYLPDTEEEFQAVIEAEEMRYQHYVWEQQDMYYDRDWNYSGLR